MRESIEIVLNCNELFYRIYPKVSTENGISISESGQRGHVSKENTPIIHNSNSLLPLLSRHLEMIYVILEQTVLTIQNILL